MRKNINKISKLIIFAFVCVLLSAPLSAKAVSNTNITIIFEKTPLFKDAPIAPGYEVSRKVTIINHSNSTKKIQYRVRVNEDKSSSDMLELTNLRIILGENQLSNGSLSDLNGQEISLSDIAPNSSISFDAKLKLNEKAGNDIQGKSIFFDLDFGFKGESVESPSPEPETSPTASPSPSINGGGGGGGAITFPTLVDSGTQNPQNGGGSSTGSGTNTENSDNQNTNTSNDGGSNGSSDRRINSISSIVNNIASSLGIIGGSLSQDFGETGSITQEEIAQASISDNTSLLSTIGLQDIKDLALPLSIIALIFLIIILLKRRKKEE